MAARRIFENEIDRAWRVALTQAARKLGITIPYRALLTTRVEQLGMLTDPLLDRIKRLTTQDEANSRQTERLKASLEKADKEVDAMIAERRRYDVAVANELLAVHRDFRRVSNERDDLLRRLQIMADAKRPAAGAAAPHEPDTAALTNGAPRAS